MGFWPRDVGDESCDFATASTSRYAAQQKGPTNLHTRGGRGTDLSLETGPDIQNLELSVPYRQC